jgi:hypothetical protein
MATPQRGGSPLEGTEKTPYGKFCKLKSSSFEQSHEFGCAIVCDCTSVKINRCDSLKNYAFTLACTPQKLFLPHAFVVVIMLSCCRTSAVQLYLLRAVGLWLLQYPA